MIGLASVPNETGPSHGSSEIIMREAVGSWVMTLNLCAYSYKKMCISNLFRGVTSALLWEDRGVKSFLEHMGQVLSHSKDIIRRGPGLHASTEHHSSIYPWLDAKPEASRRMYSRLREGP